MNLFGSTVPKTPMCFPKREPTTIQNTTGHSADDTHALFNMGNSVATFTSSVGLRTVPEQVDYGTYQASQSPSPSSLQKPRGVPRKQKHYKYTFVNPKTTGGNRKKTPRKSSARKAKSTTPTVAVSQKRTTQAPHVPVKRKLSKQDVLPEHTSKSTKTTVAAIEIHPVTFRPTATMTTTTAGHRRLSSDNSSQPVSPCQQKLPLIAHDASPVSIQLANDMASCAFSSAAAMMNTNGGVAPMNTDGAFASNVTHQ